MNYDNTKQYNRGKDILYFNKLLSLISITFILVIIFILLFTCNVQAFDERIQSTIQENRNPLLDHFMDSVTHLGDGFITGGVALSIPDIQAQEHALKSQLVNFIATSFLKVSIGRQRPSSYNLQSNNFKTFQLNSSYHSMPSGHTSAAFALATSISESYPEYRRIVYTLACMVAFSRIYRNNHWTTDVIVGAGVGYLSAKFVSYHW